MPQFGQLQVPDDKFEVLIRQSAFEFVQVSVGIPTEIRHKMDLLFDEASEEHIWEYVIALLRVQTDDISTRDNQLTLHPDFVAATRAAETLGKQLAYDTILTDYTLKQAAMRYERESEALIDR